MKKIFTILACAGMVLFAAGCGEDDPPYVPGTGQEGGESGGTQVDWETWEKDGTMAKRGVSDSLDISCSMFEGKPISVKYDALENRLVHVIYYVPSLTGVKDMPILFAMHGAERVGGTMINAFKPFADRYGFILVVPQFLRSSDITKKNETTKEYVFSEEMRARYNGVSFWPENDYQFGGVTTSKTSGEIRDKSLWTYPVIEAIFEYVRNETGNLSRGYYMFGHSAGGQFVNRMVMAYPEARIIKCVAANPSSWAWPSVEGMIVNPNPTVDDKITSCESPWPYTVKGLYSDISGLSKPFAKRMLVQVGTADMETSSLDQSNQAMAQGYRRYPRGRNFYQVCQAVAAAGKITCNFKFAEVEGAGHGTYAMLYGLSSGRSSSRISYDQLGSSAAFTFLFRGVLSERSDSEETEETEEIEDLY